MTDKGRRTLTQYHTRELDRGVARTNMKALGLRQVAKGKNSFFSDKWRKYAEVDIHGKSKGAVKKEVALEGSEISEV